MSTITIPRETFDAMLEALERIVVWNTNPLDSGLDAGRGITSVQLAQASEALTAAKAVSVEACTCQVKEMPFGRCCKAVQPQAQGVEPVGAESKFVSSREWSRCTIEHHEMVQLSPSDWNGYETRLLYTTPQEPAAAALLKTLIEAREALQFANDSPKGPICDTIWMMHRPETLFDFLDVAIENATAAPGGAA